MTTFEKISLEAGKIKLKEMLILLDKKQVIFFNRLFGSVESITLENIVSAINLCERTLVEKDIKQS